MTDAQSEDVKTEISSNSNLLNLAIEEVSVQVSRARYEAKKLDRWAEEARKDYYSKREEAEKANDVLQREELILNALLNEVAKNG